LNRTARNALELRSFITFGALLLGMGAAWQRASAQPAPDEPDPLLLKKEIAAQYVIKVSAPKYPILAKMNFIEGKVRVLVTVGEDGSVLAVHIVKGHPFLALATLKAVRDWLFRPAVQRGGPKEFMTFVDVRFSLRFKEIRSRPATPELDLRRQILPPQLLEQPADSSHATHVRLRVLVGPQGKALDATPLDKNTPLLGKARRIVDHWKFQPARWGALPVPWYLNVDVPVETWSAARGAAGAGG
jgi:TonB family protein